MGARQSAGVHRRKASEDLPTRPVILTTPQEFLFEIGTEELPASDLQSALAQLKERLPAMLDDLRLPHGEVIILGTPRRLVASVAGLAARQADRTQLVKGPPASRAFDAMGLPTKAAEGFAKSRGIDVKALEVREIDGGKYAVAEVTESGRPAVEVLSEALPRLIAAIKFDKPMRWNSSNVYFSRPIRWLLALLGGQVVPFEYAGVQSGHNHAWPALLEPRRNRSHIPPRNILELWLPRGSCSTPKSAGIPSPTRSSAWRSRRVGRINWMRPCWTRSTNWLRRRLPCAAPSRNRIYACLPRCSISVMKKHQRYFPAQTSEGRLLPVFIAVRNGDDQYLDIVTDGNEQVIRARYADAAFFIDQDLHHKLEDFLPRLGTLIFQTKLGSMLDKSKRIERLVEPLSPWVGCARTWTLCAAPPTCARPTWFRTWWWR